MIAQVHTGCVDGVEALLVQAEVALTTALPAFHVVGLAQGSVREGRERVAAALRSSGFSLPPRRITVNLAPADVRKAGTAFDLPIAVGILAAAGVVPPEALVAAAFIGEVGLDGRLRPVSGVLPVALEVRDAGLKRLFVPRGCEAEASLARGLRVVALDDLAGVVDALCGGAVPRDAVGRRRTPRVGPRLEESREELREDGSEKSGVDSTGDVQPELADVLGQGAGKRALEIAAAGRHHLLMTGPPGSGKTMLARRMPGILPPLTEVEALEVARLRSVAGLAVTTADYFTPPFRAPHHSVSYAGLVGGGRPLRPGEISLAHRGVLFLDELPEFRRDAIEVLRQPLEEGAVTIARAGGAVQVPCDFLLVAAMNPCPCGYLGDAGNRCRCDPHSVHRYRSRVSGPLLDRMDLFVEMPALPTDVLVSKHASGEVEPEQTTRACASRVAAARLLVGNERSDEERLAPAARRLVRESAAGGALSARGYHRVLRVSATIAALAGSERIHEDHVAEALHFRLPSHPAL